MFETIGLSGDWYLERKQSKDSGIVTSMSLVIISKILNSFAFRVIMCDILTKGYAFRKFS